MILGIECIIKFNLMTGYIMPYHKLQSNYNYTTILPALLHCDLLFTDKLTCQQWNLLWRTEASIPTIEEHLIKPNFYIASAGINI